jgi:hypothetical protein
MPYRHRCPGAKREAFASPFTHSKRTCCLHPGRQGLCLIYVTPCRHTGKVHDLLALHHHPPAALSASPRTGRVLTKATASFLQLASSSDFEKIAGAPRPASGPLSFQRKSFRNADARPVTYLRSFPADDPKNSGKFRDRSGLTLGRLGSSCHASASPRFVAA